MWMRNSSNKDQKPEAALCSITTHKTITATDCLKCRSSKNGFASINHQPAKETEENRMGLINDQQQLGSGRWSPTPKQLLVLEEMYRHGTRTPTADEIQQIASQLQRYGQIEGKNVFYWFQNHKARERQKRRREDTSYEGLLHGRQELDTREYTGLRRTLQELEQGHLLSTHGESKNPTNGWTELHGRESQSRSRGLGRHAAWQSTPSCSSSLPINRISKSIPRPPRLINREDHDSLNLKPEKHYYHFQSNILDQEGTKEVKTLQLFPLSSDGCTMKDMRVPITTTTTTGLGPSQFFEFLPLKTKSNS